MSSSSQLDARVRLPQKRYRSCKVCKAEDIEQFYQKCTKCHSWVCLEHQRFRDQQIVCTKCAKPADARMSTPRRSMKDTGNKPTSPTLPLPDKAPTALRPILPQSSTPPKRNGDRDTSAIRDTSMPKSPRLGQDRETTPRHLERENEDLRQQLEEARLRLHASDREVQRQHDKIEEVTYSCDPVIQARGK